MHRPELIQAELVNPQRAIVRKSVHDPHKYFARVLAQYHFPYDLEEQLQQRFVSIKASAEATRPNGKKNLPNFPFIIHHLLVDLDLQREAAIVTLPKDPKVNKRLKKWWQAIKQHELSHGTATSEHRFIAAACRPYAVPVGQIQTFCGPSSRRQIPGSYCTRPKGHSSADSATAIWYRARRQRVSFPAVLANNGGLCICACTA